METKHVVVIGAGFGGLHAIRRLGRDYRVRITLVDQNNYHLFQPLLYQVAIAGLEAPQVTFPVRAYLRRFPRTRFHLGRVERVEPENNVVWVGDTPVPYDYLIVGTGSKSSDFGIEGVNDHSTGLKSLKEALRIRDRVLSACEEAVHTMDDVRRRALLSFVVIGGGPTGVELAGAIAELKRHVIPRDYPDIDPAEIRVALVEMAPRVLNHLSPESSEYAQEFLRSMGVELHLSAPVERVTPTAVHVKGGSLIPSFNAIWSAGIAGAGPRGLPEPGRGGRIETTPELHLADHPNVYIVGDLNGLAAPQSGRPYPQVAPLAIQQGLHAAKNIQRELGGNAKAPFRYFDKGNMVTLGRNHAVAETKWARYKGLPAWVTWLAVHLMYLLGGRNRFMVLSNWAYSYFTYDYAVRTMHKRIEFPPLPERAYETERPQPAEPTRHS